MTVYLRKDAASTQSTTSAATQPSSSWAGLSKAQAPTEDERTIEIDMQNKHSSQILEFFIAETRAVPLKPAEEDVAEMQSLDELKKQSEYDRQYMQNIKAEKKREADMLRRAREAGGMSDD